MHPKNYEDFIILLRARLGSLKEMAKGSEYWQELEDIIGEADGRPRSSKPSASLLSRAQIVVNGTAEFFFSSRLLKCPFATVARNAA